MLDTGAPVYLRSKDWLQKIISKFEILDLGELLVPADRLRIQLGNGTNIPFVGWVKLEIQLEGVDVAL